MSDLQDGKLERMLRSRRLEPPRSDLSQRIMLRARQTPQEATPTAVQWITRLFAEFHLPKPAYVIAGTLVLGFVLGLNAPDDGPAEDQAAASIQSILYAEETIL